MRWTKEELQYLRDHVQGKTSQQLANEINKKFRRDFTVMQVQSAKKNHKIPSGVDSRFKKGNPSPTKGRKMTYVISPESRERMTASYFRKGIRPYNWCPVGTEVIKSDGYWWRKIEEPRKWRQVHILNWESENGPLEPNMRLVFLDGDKNNVSVDNLEKVSLAENSLMTKYGLRSCDPMITKTGVACVKIIAATKVLEEKWKR